MNYLRLTRLAGLTVLAFTGALGAQGVRYPATRTVSHEDDYGGIKVLDPYRWLEDLNSADTKAWIGAQNGVTRAYLDALPMRAHFNARITKLWNYPKTSIPFREGGRLWYRRNSGLQQQSVLYSRASVRGPALRVLDPNALSPDGSLALTLTTPSPDGKYLAVGVSEGGSDWRTVTILKLATGETMRDTVKYIKFSGVSWTEDAKGFFYSRYPEPSVGDALKGALSNNRLYYHRLGTAQASDLLVHERNDEPSWRISGRLTEDGRYLLISLARGGTENQLLYADLRDPKAPDVTARVKPLFATWDAAYIPVANVGTTFYLRTDRQAPKQKIVAFNIATPTRWRTIVPESKDAIDQVAVLKERIAVNYLEDVKARGARLRS